MKAFPRWFRVWGVLVVLPLVAASPARAQGQSAGLETGFSLLSDLVTLVDRAGQGLIDAPAAGARILALAERLTSAAAAKRVDPIFAVRYSRLLSALRQGLLTDPGMLYWPMYRYEMADFIEQRTGRPPDWDRLLLVVGDHGGSGVGLALLVEPVMSEVVSLHLHLETIDRRSEVLESYLQRAQRKR